MNDTHSNWERLLQDILQEQDKDRLTKKVEALEAEIFQRYQDLELSLDGDAERAKLKEATDKLFQIKIEKLGFPMRGLRRIGAAGEGQQ